MGSEPDVAASSRTPGKSRASARTVMCFRPRSILSPGNCRCTSPVLVFSFSEKPGERRHLYFGREHRHGDEWRSRRGANHSRCCIFARRSGINRAGRSRHSHPRSARTTPSSARCSDRRIFSTSSRTTRGFVHNIYVQLPRRSARRSAPAPGDKVVVRLESWESRHVNPEGQIVELLGPRDATGRGYAFDHPEVSSADGISSASSATRRNGFRRRSSREACGEREDLRAQFIVTIDPDDARDFDDAIYVERLGDGWRLGVHIADVSHLCYARAARSTARRCMRGNSVYLRRSRDPDAAGTIEQRRLQSEAGRRSADAFRVHRVREKTAGTKSARFARTIIRSAHRLTYRGGLRAAENPPNDT